MWPVKEIQDYREKLLGMLAESMAAEDDISMIYEDSLKRREAQLAEVIEQARRSMGSQPLELPSAGSTFKRPAGHFAGALIQDAGLKGRGVGGAKVSEKHAGFVVNFDHATAADVRATIALVQKTVYETSGVRLEPEVRIW